MRQRSPVGAPPASHHRRVLGLLVRLGVLLAVIAVPTAVQAADTCDGHWPRSVGGKPATYASGARAGDYIWHNANGWHLRVTHAGSGKRVFSGRVIADTPMRVTGVRLERGDTFTLSADRRSFTYRFRNFGHVDGLDFTTACANRLRIRGSMDGELLPTGRIHIGRNGVHPLQNPFVILRVQ